MRITLEILPDSQAPLIIETYARSGGWRSVALDGDMGAFAGKVLAAGIMSTLEQSRGETAATAARATAIAEVRANVTIKLV